MRSQGDIFSPGLLAWALSILLLMYADAFLLWGEWGTPTVVWGLETAMTILCLGFLVLWLGAGLWALVRARSRV